MGGKAVLFTAGGIINWCSHYGNPCGEFPKQNKAEQNTKQTNTKTNLPYDLDIPFLGIYSKDFSILLHRYFLAIFIAALCPTARKWEHPKCLSANKWTVNFWYSSNSSVVKNETMNFSGEVMEAEKILLSNQDPER